MGTVVLASSPGRLFFFQRHDDANESWYAGGHCDRSAQTRERPRLDLELSGAGIAFSTWFRHLVMLCVDCIPTALHKATEESAPSACYTSLLLLRNCSGSSS
jgi:hypothetical protein